MDVTRGVQAVAKELEDKSTSGGLKSFEKVRLPALFCAFLFPFCCFVFAVKYALALDARHVCR